MVSTPLYVACQVRASPHLHLLEVVVLYRKVVYYWHPCKLQVNACVYPSRLDPPTFCPCG